MANLELFEHRRCEGLYVDPDLDGIGKLKMGTGLTLRRAADLLGISSRDLDELLDSGALKSATDANGRTVVKATDLQAFTDACRPITFSVTTKGAEADESGESADADLAADTTAPATAPAAPAVPVAANGTRRNPALEGDMQPAEAGWVQVRLADLARFIRTGEFGPAAPAVPAAPAPVRSLRNGR